MSRILLVLTIWSVNVEAQKYPKYLGSIGGLPKYEPYQPNQQIALPSNGGSRTRSRGVGPDGMVTGSEMATEVWPTRGGSGNQKNNHLAGRNANNNVEYLWQQQNSGIGAGSPHVGSEYPWDVINPVGVGDGILNTGGMQRQLAQPNGKSASIGSGLGGSSVEPNIPYEQVPYNNGVLYDIYRQYNGPVDHYVNVVPNIYDPFTMSTAINAPNYLPPSMATEPVSGQRPVSPWDQFATDIGLEQGIDIAVSNGNTPIQGRSVNLIGNGRTIDRIHVGEPVYEQPMVNAGQGIINNRGYPGSNGQTLDFIPGNGGPRNIEPFNPGNIDAILQSPFPEKGVQNAVFVIPINLDQLLEKSPGSGFDPNLIGCLGPNCGTSPVSGSFIDVADQLTDPRAGPGVSPDIIIDPLYPHTTTRIIESQLSNGYKPKSKYNKPTYNTRLYSKPKQTYVSDGQTYERPISYSKPMYRSKHNMYNKLQVKYGKHKVFNEKGYNKPTKYINTVNYGKSNYQKKKTYSEPRKYRTKSSYSKRRSYKKINKKVNTYRMKIG